MAVKAEFEKLGILPLRVSLGEVNLKEAELPGRVMEELDMSLEKLGFERIDSRTNQIIEKIKNIVIRRIHHSEVDLNNTRKWSDIISSELNYDYNHLSKMFSSAEGISLEQYIIRQKVEKIKELIVYDDLSHTEIAFRLGYSSPAHLSSQFRRITGISPREYRKLNKDNRKPLDRIT